MPTGGGKSLTFQVPALAMEGVCIVVTPAYCTHEDQVENLKSVESAPQPYIPACRMTKLIIRLTIVSFRLINFIRIAWTIINSWFFLEKIKQTKVCIIAVDESHCISQWGYDFRPSYLHIADIREITSGHSRAGAYRHCHPRSCSRHSGETSFSSKKRLSEKLFPFQSCIRGSYHRKQRWTTAQNTEQRTGNIGGLCTQSKRTKEIADFLNLEWHISRTFPCRIEKWDKDERQRR